MAVKAAPQQLRLAMIFSAATGLRAGELHALRWRHLNLGDGYVTVETRVDCYGEEDGQGTKSAAGNRKVPLGTSLAQMLVDWRSTSRYPTDDDLVFPNGQGRYLAHTYMLKRWFHPIFIQLQAEHLKSPSSTPSVTRFRWHGLRHFAISRWIEEGVNLKTVQTWAGHSSAQITIDRYGHMFPSENHVTIADQISGFFSTDL